MSRNLIPIDLSHLSHPNDWLRIIEEVATTKTPRELKRDSKTVAILMPPETKTTPRKTRAKTKSDYEASLAAIGSWSDLDTDAVIAHVYHAREAGSRPATRP